MVAIKRGDWRLNGKELRALYELYGVSIGPMLRAGAVQMDRAPLFRRAAQAEADSAAGEATRLLQASAARCVESERASATRWSRTIRRRSASSAAKCRSRRRMRRRSCVHGWGSGNHRFRTCSP